MLVVRHLLAAVLSGAIASACDDSAQTPVDASRPDVAAAPDAPVAPCSAADDPDRDGISNRFEGTDDTDHDDVPDQRDPDSDDDGIPDAFEASAGRERACLTAPVDSDLDGTPDYQDSDSNGDTLADTAEAAPSPTQRADPMPLRDCLEGPPAGVRPSVVTAWTCHPYDTDGDGLPDYADPDIDDDRIQNPLEILPGGPRSPTDTDGDGLADYRDADSDGDTVADVHEGALDRDGDGSPNFRDLDSDGDSPEGITANDDAREAGDNDPRTAPFECAREIDARTLDLASRRPDGVPDFLDTDSDNDGLSDADEARAATDRCNADSDSDGTLDSVEVAWCRAAGLARCATDAAVRVPADEVWVALPYMGPAAQRELAFDASVRAADVFFLVDTAARNEAPLRALQGALTAPRGGIVDALREVALDVQVGVGHFEDFAAGPAASPYGAEGDRPLWPLCPGALGTTGCRPGWGITMQPVARAVDVLAVTQSLTLRGGGDAPGSQIEALYQTLTGEGLFSGDAATACASSPGAAPCWVAPRQCADGTRGAACFRRGALPVVVLITATDFHGGLPDVAGGAPWSPYAGIAPAPHAFADLAGVLTATGARVVGVNAHPTARCESARMMRVEGEPCFDLLSVARASGSVDRAGRPLVYDLPRPTLPAAVLASTATALRTVAREVPFDVTLMVRADAMNPAMIDATRFVRGRTPTCQVGAVTDRCWTPPAGVAMSAAVARTDNNGFYRVVPGTQVRFTVTLRNESVYEGSDGLSVFKLYFDAMGDGSRLDTREVNVVVPASQNGL